MIVLILTVIIAGILVYGIIRLNMAIKGLEGLLVRFIEINQQFYETQKNIINQLTETLTIMTKETLANKNLVAEIHRQVQEQTMRTKDTYIIAQKLSTELKKEFDRKPPKPYKNT